MVGNVYCPNDHALSKYFMENMYHRKYCFIISDSETGPFQKLSRTLHGVVSIEFFPLGSMDTNNGYQLHNGEY